MRVFKACVIAVAISLGLAGCGQDSPASVATSASAKPTLQDVEGKATGFVVGNMMAATTVNVFFDPQCPHCGRLWEESKVLKGRMKFRWIPVGLLNRASVAQGIALLQAQDPSQAMQSHEDSLLARQGGITGGDVSVEAAAHIKTNSELLKSLGAQSVPYLMGRHAKTGEVVILDQGFAPREIAQRFGVDL